jgi:hypothetical protein
VPDELTIVRVGHPLRGVRLRVDRRAGVARRDRRIQVFLPDGSTTLLPVEFTDLGARLESHTPTLFTRDGARRLLRLAAGAREGTNPP